MDGMSGRSPDGGLGSAAPKRWYPESAWGEAGCQRKARAVCKSKALRSTATDRFGCRLASSLNADIRLRQAAGRVFFHEVEKCISKGFFLGGEDVTVFEGFPMGDQYAVTVVRGAGYVLQITFGDQASDGHHGGTFDLLLAIKDPVPGVHVED